MTLIKPDNAQIRSIDIHSWIGDGGVNLFEGLRFKDKDGNVLLESGEFPAPSETEIDSTILINEDERIIGVRSKSSKSGNEKGKHYDIEFLICKKSE